MEEKVKKMPLWLRIVIYVAFAVGCALGGVGMTSCGRAFHYGGIYEDKTDTVVVDIIHGEEINNVIENGTW